MATEIEKHLTPGHGPADQWKHSPSGRRARSGAPRTSPLVRSSGRSRSGRTRSAKLGDGSFDTSTHTSTAEARRSTLGTKQNPIKVSSATEALDLIAQGKHVTMDPDTVGVVLEKLAEIGQKAFEAEKSGKKVDIPDYDLCRIHVPDTNLFCVKNKGIPRIKMPQVKGKNIRPGSKAAALLKQQNEENGTPDNLEVDGTAAFVQYLSDKGVTISRNQIIPADKLKATQSQLVGSKVGGMMGARAAGKFDPAKDSIFVSTDNYVLDGHHRWAAVVGSEFAEGKTINMKADVIDLPIQELVDMTNQFLDDFGILPNAATATSKSAPRELPCIGCGDESSLDDSFRHRELLAKKDGRDYTIPSRKSSAKEIVGSHGHKPHGTSILWPALYEELLKKGYSKAKAAAISNAKWNEKHGRGAKNLASTRVTKADGVEGVIAKTDDDKQLVYGWMYVTHNRDGEVVVDKSGDFIDEVDELDEAVVDFVLHERVGGVDHEREGDTPRQASRLVESIVFTPEKIEALGLQPGDLPTGWWAGWKVDDPEVWEGVKTGRYKSFSIHGSGLREPVHADVAKSYRVTGDIGGGGRGRRYRALSPAEIQQRKDAAIASARKRRKGNKLVQRLRDRRAFRRSQRAGDDLAGITPSTPMTQRIDAVNRRNATRERIARGQARENDELRLELQRERVVDMIDFQRNLPPSQRRRLLVKKAPTGTDRRRMAATYTGRQVSGARSGTLSSRERKQRQDAARASANKRRGSGSKDKNPQTPETKARERTRIRTETPGTPEHASAMTRMKRAITSGRPLKVREGELDSVIEKAKAQGLEYSEANGVVTIKLSDGRKLQVTSSGNKKES